MPRFCTHGVIYSRGQRRPLTKREVFAPLGVPEDGGWYSHLIDELPYLQIVALAGNGMCMLPSACWLFFVLCHLERRDIIEQREEAIALRSFAVASPVADEDDDEDSREPIVADSGGLQPQQIPLPRPPSISDIIAWRRRRSAPPPPSWSDDEPLQN